MNRQEFTEKLLERAKRAGFDAAEVFVSEADEFETSVDRGEIIKYGAAESFNLGFRALLGGKSGCATTQVMDEDAIDMLICAAKEGAQMSENPDPEFLYAGSDAYPEAPAPSAELEALTPRDKIEMARNLERMALDADARIESCYGCGVETQDERTYLVNSLGLNVSSHRRAIAAYIAPIARDGEKTGVGGGEALTTDARGIDFAAMARNSVKEACDFLNAAPVQSGSYPILLRGDMAATILGTFAGVFSADTAQKGFSLLAGREGEQIAAPCVTLTDDPFRADRFYSRTFDAEGVCARRKHLIENGTLNTLMHNLKTAHKQGVESTGNAVRASAAGPIGVSASNLLIQPGAYTREKLIAAQDRALLITDLMGMHSGANAVSGDFSLGAKGYLIEGGEIVRTVNQITIAGNFFELLKNVDAVCDDLYFGMARYGSPTIRIRELSVAGK